MSIIRLKFKSLKKDYAHEVMWYIDPKQRQRKGLKLMVQKLFQKRAVVANVLIIPSFDIYVNGRVSQKSTVHLHPLHPHYIAPA